jgi:hypothetical protein
MERILDRLVAEHEQLVHHHQEFAREHRQLLTAQVVLTDRVDRLVEAQEHTETRLQALIAVVDDLVRRRDRDRRE